MKKKIALATAFILLLVLTGYGTYAYLTARGTAHNVITAGNVKIALSEAPDTLKVMPSTETQHNEYPDTTYVMPATETQHEVIVENIGANDCFVRVKLEIVMESDAENPLETDGKITLNLDEQNWKQDEEGFWRYVKKLAPGEKTSNLLTGILFNASMGNEYQNAVFHISVSAQAVQAANNGYESELGSIMDVKGWPQSETPEASGIPAE